MSDQSNLCAKQEVLFCGETEAKVGDEGIVFVKEIELSDSIMRSIDEVLSGSKELLKFAKKLQDQVAVRDEDYWVIVK